MRGLTAPDLLAVWETGRSAHRLERPIAALSAALPELTPADLAHMPLGARDALLIELHAATFGPLIEAVASCPGCAEAVEFGLPAEQLVTGDAHVSLLTAGRLELAGRVFEYRLPDTEDLVAASAAPDAQRARTLIVERCVDASPADLTDEDMAVIANELAARQPSSDIQVDLKCPSCGTGWCAYLDVGAFVWDEVAAEARRLVNEIDHLARGYCWSEADILAMTPARRQTYMALVE